MTFFKGTKLYSILKAKCPVCHEGNLYKVSNSYKIATTLEMHDNCTHCNTKYKIEPSFFYGAMYVSYGVGIAFATATFIVTYFMLNWSRFNVFLAIVATLILFLPIIVRLSRNIWINFFFKYDKKKAKSNS